MSKKFKHRVPRQWKYRAKNRSLSSLVHKRWKKKEKKNAKIKRKRIEKRWNTLIYLLLSFIIGYFIYCFILR
jgi:hypothetical protein